MSASCHSALSGLGQPEEPHVREEDVKNQMREKHGSEWESMKEERQGGNHGRV